MAIEFLQQTGVSFKSPEWLGKTRCKRHDAWSWCSEALHITAQFIPEEIKNVRLFARFAYMIICRSYFCNLHFFIRTSMGASHIWPA